METRREQTPAWSVSCARSKGDSRMYGHSSPTDQFTGDQEERRLPVLALKLESPLQNTAQCFGRVRLTLDGELG